MTLGWTKWNRRQLLRLGGFAPLAGLGLSQSTSAAASGKADRTAGNDMRGPMLFVPTPFRVQNGQTVPDYDGMAGNVALLSKHSGAYSLCICGGTGEFGDLTAPEIDELTRAAAAAKGRVPLIVGVGGQTVAESSRRAEGLQKAGADALLGMPMEGQQNPSQEEMLEYFGALLDAVEIKVLPYRSARLPMEKESILKLLDKPNFVALKSSGKDAEWYRDVFRSSAQRLAMYPGSDFGAPYWHLAGCAGYTTGLANLVLARSAAHWEMLEQGKYREAVQEIDFLLPLQAFRSKHGNAMLKAGLEMLGGAGGPVRRSGKVLSAEEKSELRALMAEAGAF